MAVTTVQKTIGSTGTFSTVQLWEDGAPADLTTSERSAATSFLVAGFIQGESLLFVGSAATGKFLDTDSTGVGNGTYVTYGITAGNPAANDVVTGVTSGATCVLTSGTPDFTGIVWEGQCQNQQFSVADTVCTIAGSTTSVTAFKRLTTATGASFRDSATRLTNVLRYNSTVGCGLLNTGTVNSTIAITDSVAQVTNLQIANSFTAGRALTHQSAGLIDSCVMSGGATSSLAVIGTLIATGNPTFRNCLVFQNSGAADHIVATGTGSPNFYNCTIVAADDLTAPASVFKSGASGTVTVQNCGLFAGSSASAIVSGSATFNFTTCFSDISGTTGVTQCTYTAEFQNVNVGSGDFRLKTGAAEINAGTTDTTNAQFDIVGTARPQGSAWDVGCWEVDAPSAQIMM